MKERKKERPVLWNKEIPDYHDKVMTGGANSRM